MRKVEECLLRRALRVVGRLRVAEQRPGPQPLGDLWAALACLLDGDWPGTDANLGRLERLLKLSPLPEHEHDGA